MKLKSRLRLVKNGEAITPLPYMRLWRVAQPIKHKDNFVCITAIMNIEVKNGAVVPALPHTSAWLVA